MMFIKDLLSVIPNSEYKYRKGVDFKEVVKQAKEREYTSIVVVNEDQKKASECFSYSQLVIRISLSELDYTDS